jgi:hypothetical protein
MVGVSVLTYGVKAFRVNRGNTPRKGLASTVPLLVRNLLLSAVTNLSVMDYWESSRSSGRPG